MRYASQNVVLAFASRPPSSTTQYAVVVALRVPSVALPRV